MESLASDKFFRTDFLNFVLPNLKKELGERISSDFTAENVQAHHSLVQRGIIKDYSAVFLFDRIDAVSHHVIRQALVSGMYTNGYRGNCMALSYWFTIFLRECYEACYTKLAEKLSAQNQSNADLVDEIATISEQGLQFQLVENQFSYVNPTIGPISPQIISELREECKDIRFVRETLSNTYPRLHRALVRYDDEISKTSPDVMHLFVYGGDLQSEFVHVRSQNPETSGIPAIDLSIQAMIDSLILRHALLVMSSLAVRDFVVQYEAIRSLGTLPEPTRTSPFSQTVSAMRTASVFDEQTRRLAADITPASNTEPQPHLEAAASAMARGSLAAMGEFARETLNKGVKEGIKDAVKDETTKLIQNESIRVGIQNFLRECVESIGEMVARYPATFGWASSILRYFLSQKPDRV